MLVGAYGSFFVAEDILKSSGIMAVVALGMTLSVMPTSADKPQLEDGIRLICASSFAWLQCQPDAPFYKCQLPSLNVNCSAPDMPCQGAFHANAYSAIVKLSENNV